MEPLIVHRPVRFRSDEFRRCRLTAPRGMNSVYASSQQVRTCSRVLEGGFLPTFASLTDGNRGGAARVEPPPFQAISNGAPTALARVAV